MPKPINLCIAVYNRYDLLTKVIDSAINGTVKPTQINIVDNGKKFIENFGKLDNVEGIPLNLLVPKFEQYGLARSFNYFLHKYDDDIIISNDDAIFHKETIELLTAAAHENPNEIFFVPDNYWENHWSLFLQRKDSLSIIGEYDGNYFPAYFEDADYLYRMKLKGYKPFVVKECTYTHEDGGSNSIKQIADKISFNKRFAQLGQYFTSKWGGLRNNESYTKPFNLIG